MAQESQVLVEIKKKLIEGMMMKRRKFWSFKTRREVSYHFKIGSPPLNLMEETRNRNSRPTKMVRESDISMMMTRGPSKHWSGRRNSVVEVTTLTPSTGWLEGWVEECAALIIYFILENVVFFGWCLLNGFAFSRFSFKSKKLSNIFIMLINWNYWLLLLLLFI